MPLLHSRASIHQRRPLAELLAYTVSKLFPHVLLVGGGVTKLGFFYDFIFEQTVHADMLAFIEVHLRALIKEGEVVQSLSMMRENARAFFLHRQQPFLAEKVSQEAQNIVDLIQIDQFYGLCPPSSLTSTREAGSVKLLQTSSRRLMSNLSEEEVEVTRILGTSFDSNQTLKQFLKRYDLFLKKKDHRLIGQEMNLFSASKGVSPVEWIWHPRGEVIKQVLQAWVEKERDREFAFQRVSTPLVVDSTVFGKNLSVFELADQSCVLSPSRLPQHLYLFQRHPFASEELPLRFFESSPVYSRQVGSLDEGLLDSACYLKDQLTTFCSFEQLSQEFISSLHFIEQIIRIFGFEAHWYLVASRQKSFKAKQEKKILDWIRQMVQDYSFFYPLDSALQEEEDLEGPRLELRVVDEVGREWPSSAITLVVPQSLKLWNLKAEKESDPPFVVSQQVWGSLDRFIALLIERFEGVLPLWLAPEQMRILPVGESVQGYAKTVEESCKKRGFRVKLDCRSTKLGEKIHAAEKDRIPYLLIVGDQESKKQSVTVRSIQQSGRSQLLNLERFLEQVNQECVYPTLVGSYL